MASLEQNEEKEKPLAPLDDDRKFFIANMDYNTTPEDIKSFFSTFGTVNFVKLIYDGKSNRSKGYGFLFMKDVAGDAAVESFAAANENRFTLMGKARVYLARHDHARVKPIRGPGKPDLDSGASRGRGRGRGRGGSAPSQRPMSSYDATSSQGPGYYGPRSSYDPQIYSDPYFQSYPSRQDQSFPPQQTYPSSGGYGPQPYGGGGYDYVPEDYNPGGGYAATADYSQYPTATGGGGGVGPGYGDPNAAYGGPSAYTNSADQYSQYPGDSYSYPDYSGGGNPNASYTGYSTYSGHNSSLSYPSAGVDYSSYPAYSDAQSGPPYNSSSFSFALPPSRPRGPPPGSGATPPPGSLSAPPGRGDSAGRGGPRPSGPRPPSRGGGGGGQGRSHVDRNRRRDRPY